MVTGVPPATGGVSRGTLGVASAGGGGGQWPAGGPVSASPRRPPRAHRQRHCSRGTPPPAGWGPVMSQFGADGSVSVGSDSSGVDSGVQAGSGVGEAGSACAVVALVG